MSYGNISFNKQKQEGFTLLELLISITILAMILGIIMGAMRLASRAFEAGDKQIDKIQHVRVMYDFIMEDIRSMVVSDSESVKNKRSKSKSKCIEGDICPERSECSKKAPLFIGEPHRITFLSTNPGLDRSLAKSDYRVVTYYLYNESPFDDEVGDLKGIIMRERELVSQLIYKDFFKPLCDNCTSKTISDDKIDNLLSIEPISIYKDVVECLFEYYGQRDSDAEPDWHEDWNPLEKICECDRGSIEKDFPIKIRATIVYTSEDAGADEGDTEELSFEIPIMVSLTNSSINPATVSAGTDENDGNDGNGGNKNQ